MLITTNVNWIQEHDLTYKEWIVLSVVLNKYSDTNEPVNVSLIQGLGGSKQVLNNINQLSKKELLIKSKIDGERDVYAQPNKQVFGQFVDELSVHKMFSS